MAVIRRDPPTGDPFWDTVRERHPHVDIVLLPTGRPGDPDRGDPDGDPDGGELDDAALTEIRTAIDRAVLDLGATLGGGSEDGSEPVRTDSRLQSGGGVRGAVRARTLLVLRPSTPPRLDEAAVALAARGWDLTRRTGPVDRLVGVGVVVADQGPRVAVRVDLTWAPASGVLQVELTSPPLRVGVARARVLLRERSGLSEIAVEDPGR